MTHHLTVVQSEPSTETTSPVGPWEDLPDDPAHPTFDNAPRLLIARHEHLLQHDVFDEFQDVAATAVFVSDGLTGARVEFGPWSLTAKEARELARSLTVLAGAVEDVTS